MSSSNIRWFWKSNFLVDLNRPISYVFRCERRSLYFNTNKKNNKSAAAAAAAPPTPTATATSATTTTTTAAAAATTTTSTSKDNCKLHN